MEWKYKFLYKMKNNITTKDIKGNFHGMDFFMVNYR